MTTPALGDARLRLEPLRVDHAGELVDVLSDAGLYAFTGGSPPSPADLEQRYTRQVAGSPDPAEQWHNWVVRLGDDGPAAGRAGHRAPGRRGGRAGLGGRGGVAGPGDRPRGGDHVLATGVHRAVAHVRPDHVASQRVAAALGMRPTDRLVDGEVEWVLVSGG